jgi:hypothetical protein
LPPFKALPTTEKSFFDFIRAGLEIIDANADKIDHSLNGAATTPKSIISDGIVEEKSVTNVKAIVSSTEKLIETTTQQIKPKTTQTTRRPTKTTVKTVSTSKTTKLPVKFQSSSTESTKLSSPKLATTLKTKTSTKPNETSTVKSLTESGMKFGRDEN